MTIKCTAAFHQEDDWVVASCLENDVASQGRTIEEALSNLREALLLYFEEEPDVPNYPQVFVTSLDVAV